MTIRNKSNEGLAITALAIGLALLLTVQSGCLEKSKPSPNQSTSNETKPLASQSPETDNRAKSQQGRSASANQDESSGSIPQGPVGQVWFVEIREINKDTLPDMSTECMKDSLSPLRWQDGKLVLTSKEKTSTISGDSKSPFADFAVDVEPSRAVASAPLKDCKLFVRYLVEYRGSGRRGVSERWYAFSDTTGQWSQKFSETNDTMQHDPNENPLPFELWLETIRCGASKQMAFRLSADSSGIQIHLGSTPHQLKLNQSVELSNTTRNIELVQSPLTGAAFEDQSGLKSTDVILPGKEFGKIQFRTQITATNFGQVPLITE